MPYSRANKVDIWYEVAGDGPAMILVHAFKRARRQLQDHVRGLQGQVKQHSDQPIGTVTKLDGHEVYFHRNSVLDAAFDHLAIGSRVIFSEEIGEKGPQASTVKLLEKHSFRL